MTVRGPPVSKQNQVFPTMQCIVGLMGAVIALFFCSNGLRGLGG